MRSSVSDEVNRPQNETDNAGQGLLERAFARENLKRAWKRVKANKGAAGVDGLDIDQTAEYLLIQWAAIREQLLSGVYRPSPARSVTIPKPDGGQRELGIPTVTDRLIQQALLQVLQPLLDPTFSEHSYGFRPGRCAQGAVLAAQRYVSSGRKVVVDVDIKQFFVWTEHDISIKSPRDLLRRRRQMCIRRNAVSELDRKASKSHDWAAPSIASGPSTPPSHRQWRTAVGA
ncbi:hypothetical protein GIV34_22185, partial [Pseudomonas sp. PA-1-6A]|nr:hypothetical protein [Pseudomonas sp. PA-1-6A]